MRLSFKVNWIAITLLYSRFYSMFLFFLGKMIKYNDILEYNHYNACDFISLPSLRTSCDLMNG